MGVNKLRQKLIIYSVVITVLIMSLTASVISTFLYYNSNKDMKEQMKNMSNLVIDRTNSYVDGIIRNYLRGLTEYAYTTADHYYEMYQDGKMNERQAKKTVEEILLSLKVGKTGYVYCLDSDGIIRVHPKAELLNADLTKYDFIREQQKNKSGYIEYNWKNPGETVERPKALYMKYFEKWDWIISVSSYRDEFVDLIDMESLKKLTLSTVVGKSGYPFIIDDAGVLIVHPKYEGRNLITEFTDAEGNYVFKKMLQGDNDAFSYTWVENGIVKKKALEFRKLDFTNWIMAVTAYESDFYDMMVNTLVILLIATAAGIAVFIIAFNAIGKIITDPIVKTAAMLKDISEGEGDLTKRLDIKTRDEIGEMARYFNMTFDKIGNLVTAIKNQSRVLSEIGVKLSENMKETSAAINMITGNIMNIKDSTVNQSASVTQTDVTMAGMTDAIKALNENIESQSVYITESSSSIEEMAASIGAVTGTLITNTENIRNLNAASESGKIILGGMINDIKEIESESEGLLEINSVIQDIASQTDLLAMNAAIEAAHAGESGKGFAVVADEIRKLAESTGVQAKTVSGILKSIKDSIGRITLSTGQVLVNFESMETCIKNVSELEFAIKDAMEEQASGSKQILEAVSLLNDITRKVKESSLEMMTGSDEVRKESGISRRITEEVAHKMNEIASGVGQITAAINNVNEKSIENMRSIELLAGEVGKFKV